MIIGIFGKPGSGKSTAIAAFIQKNKRKKEKYYKRIEKSKIYKWCINYTNWFTEGFLNLFFSKKFYDVIYCTDPTFQDVVYVDYENLGKWKPTWNSCIILEEAGVYLSNKDWKKLTKESRRLAAMHRHSGTDIVCCSQVTDFCKDYRSRCEVMFIAKKIGPVTWYHRIPYKIDVDEERHDIVEGYYKMSPFLDLFESLMSLKKKHRYSKFPFTRSHFIWRPSWYKYFDSYVDDYDYPQIAPDLIDSEPSDSKTSDVLTLESYLDSIPSDSKNYDSESKTDDYYDSFFN